MSRRRRNRYSGELNQTFIQQQARLRSKDKCQRVHAVFTISGKAKVKEYKPRWTADRDYIIKRVRVTAGNHDPDTHPDDGCPRGAGLIVQVFKYPSTFDDGTGSRMRLFTNEERLKIPAGKHRDTAWADDIKDDAEEMLEDEFLTIKVAQVGDTYPGDSVVVTVVLEPA